jgi:hypothetical protein
MMFWKIVLDNRFVPNGHSFAREDACAPSAGVNRPPTCNSFHLELSTLIWMQQNPLQTLFRIENAVPEKI